MPSSEDQAALKNYTGLMVEARARALSINTLTRDQRGIPSPLVHEYCVLQIRMICEIVALSCLVAHGDLVGRASSSISKAYAPGKIFSSLTELHDDFFPVPVKPIKTVTGWHMADYSGGPFADKQEIIDIWNKCGELLHRGTLKNLLKQRNPVQSNFADVNNWGQKLLNLLSNHRILRNNRHQVFVTFLQVNDMNGDVVVAIAEAPVAT